MTHHSLSFIALATAAVLILPLLRGRLRWLLFLCLNLTYVQSFLTPVGMVSTASLIVAGYACARWAQGRGKVPVVLGVSLLTAAFVYLRNYDLLGAVLPGAWRTDLLATAGLSFLFFKMVHVVVDASAGTIGRLSFPAYLNYSLNFTTFLMGPIQRYQDFDSQWRGEAPSIEPGFEAHLDAVNRILRGLVKAYVLADVLGRHALSPGTDFETMSRGTLLLRTYIYYLFLYCDFSGYCDVVIGVGSLMGVRPPENFNLPFFSRNVSDYWLRVHRSLTTWLTDYVFNPSFAAALRSRFAGGTLGPLTFALMLTMLVSGLWHGTTASFVLFGLLHGVYLVVGRVYEHVGRKVMGRKGFRAFSQRRLVHVCAVFLTYNVTSFAYALFVLDIESFGRFLTRLGGGG